MNDNFEYLDNRITTVNSNIYTNNAQFTSQLTTLNTNLSNNLSSLQTELRTFANNLEASINTVDSRVSSIHYAPDYSRGWGISIPYTVGYNGWVSIYMRGAWGGHVAYVNGFQIAYVEGATDNRFTNGNVNTFMVSVGDVITATDAVAGAWFYPMKGAQ